MEETLKLDITNFYSTYYQSFNSDYFIEKYNKKNNRIEKTAKCFT